MTYQGVVARDRKSYDEGFEDGSQEAPEELAGVALEVTKAGNGYRVRSIVARDSGEEEVTVLYKGRVK